MTDMAEWRPVCSDAELPQRSVKTLRADDLCIAVFRLEDGRLFAIEDRCPHRGARLSAGLLYDGDKVACLDHGWGIRLTDGVVEPPEKGCVRTFPVRIQDGYVLVHVPKETKR